jgi:hypothetical protein
MVGTRCLACGCGGIGVGFWVDGVVVFKRFDGGEMSNKYSDSSVSSLVCVLGVIGDTAGVLGGDSICVGMCLAV